MNKEKLWEMIKPVLANYLKERSEELKAQGFIPTLEMLIEELES